MHSFSGPHRLKFLAQSLLSVYFDLTQAELVSRGSKVVFQITRGL